MDTDFEMAPLRHSMARFFVENRHVSWVLLAGVIAWGIWAYAAMPKRKDPDIPVRQVAVVTPWPGQSAERVEQLVTRKIEERVAQNIRVSEITSTTRSGLSVVYAEVDENTRIDPGKAFDDTKVKLDALTDLPEGAGPIQYIKDFGETSALMLTVASPPASGPRLQLLARQIADAAVPAPSTLDVVVCRPGSPDPSFVREAAALLGRCPRASRRGNGCSND
jgi:multidrug efflux pump subunit AcrB